MHRTLHSVLQCSSVEGTEVVECKESQRDLEIFGSWEEKGLQRKREREVEGQKIGRGRGMTIRCHG